MSPTALAEQVDAQTVDERRRAVRALLMQPLLHADVEPDLHRLVRRHSDYVKEFFAHETGWSVTVDRSVARLRKAAPTSDDPTRGARARRRDPAFSRRRYVLLCLALVVLERGERQIALGRLAEWILAEVAADPSLDDAGIRFELDNRRERRDLVAVVRLLIALGILRRVDGDEQAFVDQRGDALYSVDRSALTAVLAAPRAPSLVDAELSDAGIGARLAALTDEPIADTADARNRATRQHLTRRLIDDPVLYYDTLNDGQRDYLAGQRPRILARIREATGLLAEVRDEGIAMVDERGDATDVAMPDQGTDGHLTLLLAERLADRLRKAPGAAVPVSELEAHTAALAREHASHWRRDVTEPDAEVGLTAGALDSLAALGLVRRVEGGVVPLPAIARYRVEEPTEPSAPPTLFDAGG